MKLKRQEGKSNSFYKAELKYTYGVIFEYLKHFATFEL